MHTPVISIIIPVYNQEKYVGKCLRSVLSQSFQDFEVILVNDGSTDKSLKKCQEYAKKDGRIYIIDKQNEGLAQARKDGFLKARGEYICFMDSDDFFSKDVLKVLFKIVCETGVDMVTGVFDRVWDDWGFVRKSAVPAEKEYTDRILEASELRPLMLGLGGRRSYLWAIGINGKFYRRNCIEKAFDARGDILFPPFKNFPEDDALNLAITPFFGSIWVTNRVIHHYRYGGCTSHDFPVIRNG